MVAKSGGHPLPSLAPKPDRESSSSPIPSSATGGRKATRQHQGRPAPELLQAIKERLRATGQRWELASCLKGSQDSATQLQASRTLLTLAQYLQQHRTIVLSRPEIRHVASQLLDQQLLPTLLASGSDANGVREHAARAASALAPLLPHMLPLSAAPALVALLDWPGPEVGGLVAEVIVQRLADWRCSGLWFYWVAADGTARLCRAVCTHVVQLITAGGALPSGSSGAEALPQLLTLLARLLPLSEELTAQLAGQLDRWLQPLLQVLSQPRVAIVVQLLAAQVLHHLARHLPQFWSLTLADDVVQANLLTAMLVALTRSADHADHDSLELWTLAASILIHPSLWQASLSRPCTKPQPHTSAAPLPLAPDNCTSATAPFGSIHAPLARSGHSTSLSRAIAAQRCLWSLKTNVTSVLAAHVMRLYRQLSRQDTGPACMAHAATCTAAVQLACVVLLPSPSTYGTSCGITHGGDWDAVRAPLLEPCLLAALNWLTLYLAASAEDRQLGRSDVGVLTSGGWVAPIVLWHLRGMLLALSGSSGTQVLGNTTELSSWQVVQPRLQRPASANATTATASTGMCSLLWAHTGAHSPTPHDLSVGAAAATARLLLVQAPGPARCALSLLQLYAITPAAAALLGRADQATPRSCPSLGGTTGCSTGNGSNGVHVESRVVDALGTAVARLAAAYVKLRLCSVPSTALQHQAMQAELPQHLHDAMRVLLAVLQTYVEPASLAGATEAHRRPCAAEALLSLDVSNALRRALQEIAVAVCCGEACQGQRACPAPALDTATTPPTEKPQHGRDAASSGSGPPPSAHCQGVSSPPGAVPGALASPLRTAPPAGAASGSLLPLQADAPAQLAALLMERCRGGIRCLAAALLSCGWDQLGPLSQSPLPLAPPLHLPVPAAGYSEVAAAAAAAAAIAAASGAKSSSADASCTDLDGFADVHFQVQGGSATFAAHGAVLGAGCPLLAGHAQAAATAQRKCERDARRSSAACSDAGVSGGRSEAGEGPACTVVLSASVPVGAFAAVLTYLHSGHATWADLDSQQLPRQQQQQSPPLQSSQQWPLRPQFMSEHRTAVAKLFRALGLPALHALARGTAPLLGQTLSPSVAPDYAALLTHKILALPSSTGTDGMGGAARMTRSLGSGSPQDSTSQGGAGDEKATRCSAASTHAAGGAWDESKECKLFVLVPPDPSVPGGTQTVAARAGVADGDYAADPAATISAGRGSHPPLMAHLTSTLHATEHISGMTRLCVDARLVPAFADVAVAVPPGLQATAAAAAVPGAGPAVLLLPAHRVLLAAQAEFFSVLLSRWGGRRSGHGGEGGVSSSSSPNEVLVAAGGAAAGSTTAGSGRSYTADLNPGGPEKTAQGVQAASPLRMATTPITDAGATAPPGSEATASLPRGSNIDGVLLHVITVPEADADVAYALLTYLYTGRLVLTPPPNVLPCRVDTGAGLAADRPAPPAPVNSAHACPRQAVGTAPTLALHPMEHCSLSVQPPPLLPPPPPSPPLCAVCYALRTCARLSRCCEVLLLDAPKQLCLSYLEAALTPLSHCTNPSAVVLVPPPTGDAPPAPGYGHGSSDNVPGAAGGLALPAGCLLTLLLDLVLLDVGELAQRCAEVLTAAHDPDATKLLEEWLVLPEQLKSALNDGWSRRSHRHCGPIAVRPPSMGSSSRPTPTEHPSSGSPQPDSNAGNATASAGGPTKRHGTATTVPAEQGLAAAQLRAETDAVLAECSIWKELQLLCEAEDGSA